MRAASRTTVAVLAVLAGLCGSYNLDLDRPAVYRGPAGTMFGFSVAGYTDRDGSWVLVGAPRAQTPQPGVVEGGAVYRCATNQTGGALTAYTSCRQIPFDVNGNNIAGKRAIDEKSGQWFGAMVASTPGKDNGGVVVACAPRYVWFSSNQRRREPVGTCYVAKNGFSDIQEYAPCRTAAWGYHRQGWCQTGMGSAINKDGDRLFVGAVGSWYWQGQLFSQHLYTRPDLAGTAEGPSSEDDSYLGYSVAVGEFSGDADQDVVVGMPRGANLTGKVVLFTSGLKNLYNITGEQIGAYFGHSVAVGDINGDKLDDIIISAPFYTHFDNTEGKYETGRVVIAYQNRNHGFKRFDFLEGKNSKSRFGMALTSLGDIDWDGYGDIAVGAPHDGSSDEGAVYIYLGSKSGIAPEPSQVITASELGPNLHSLGFSLHGGLDLDQNQYPDLVIGAHDSNAAVYLRSRPVVHVEASLRYLNTGPAGQLLLDSELTSCQLQDGANASCLPLRFCLAYEGVGADKRAEFEVEFRLDARRPLSPRLFLRDQENVSRSNVTARTTLGRQWCHEHTVYVLEAVRDKLTPLVTEVHYSLVMRKPEQELGALPPVLAQHRPPLVSDTITIQKDCGSDGVCVPDLQVTARPKVIQCGWKGSEKRNHATYLLGSRERLTLDVSVFNALEGAFEAMLYLGLPKGVDYVGAERAEDSTPQPVLCTLKQLDQDVLVCDLGNPMLAGTRVHFNVHLMPETTSEEMQRHYQFTVRVNSTNVEDEVTSADNELSITLPIRVHTELAIAGISLPEVVHYNSSEFSVQQLSSKLHERLVGPQVYHVYELSNSGPSDIVAAEAVIMWPTYTLPANKHLLYLLEQPWVEGPGSCELVPGLNPLQLQLDERARRLTETTGEVAGALLAPSTRWRRDAEAEFQAALGCGPTVCTKIVCQIGPLTLHQNVIIRVRTRVWVRTIEDEIRGAASRQFTVSSKMVARVTALPYNVDPSFMNHTSYAVVTRVHSDDGRSAPVPWWVIVLASCGGVLILLLLVFILYKLGFFKRRRRPGPSPAAVTNGTGNGHRTESNAATCLKNGGGGTSVRSSDASAHGGQSTYYGFLNVPYAQPGDEAL